MSVGGTTLRMNLEDVVHHRQTKAAHQFTIELQVAAVQTVTQTVEVFQQKPSLFV